MIFVDTQQQCQKHYKSAGAKNYRVHRDTVSQQHIPSKTAQWLLQDPVAFCFAPMLAVRAML